MNTRQLRHFLAVLDLGSLSAAAEVVHLSLPALSRSLRSLEDELRVPLFDRQDRRLRPTPYALLYAERARRIVFDEKEGARSLALMHAGELGSLHFGMGSSIARTLMAPMLLQLLSEVPGLRLSTVVNSTDALLAALRREELDFFIGDIRSVALDSEMRTEPVYRCNFGWFARRGHPLDGHAVHGGRFGEGGGEGVSGASRRGWVFRRGRYRASNAGVAMRRGGGSRTRLPSR